MSKALVCLFFGFFFSKKDQVQWGLEPPPQQKCSVLIFHRDCWVRMNWLPRIME